MARYSSATDITDSLYTNMGDEFHDQAQEYVDEFFVKPAGYDPASLFADTSTIPQVLKRVAKHHAMFLFAQSQQSRQKNIEVWENQERIHREHRDEARRRFNERMLVIGDVNYESSGHTGGTTVRRYRV